MVQTAEHGTWGAEFVLPITGATTKTMFEPESDSNIRSRGEPPTLSHERSWWTYPNPGRTMTGVSCCVPSILDSLGVKVPYPA